MQGRVLVIAGSDSGGGAGIQADIKAITVLGGFASTAITALTAQNTKTISSIYSLPAEFVTEQMHLVLSDIGADCIKIGMLSNKEIINKVAKSLIKYTPEVPIVIDPVMISKSGSNLLEKDSSSTLISDLLPLATLITPNIPEAEILCRSNITGLEDMRGACQKLIDSGAKAVLLKGGHLSGHELYDVLVCDEGEFIYKGNRIDSRNTHGTGCTLASAVSVGIALGKTIPESVERARLYIREAILTAPDIGEGHGPLNHNVKLEKL
tara:strand:+ start:9947 stop:10744 length:798 start_codon:yes stop_codon:yes gene_type:complete